MFHEKCTTFPGIGTLGKSFTLGYSHCFTLMVNIVKGKVLRTQAVSDGHTRVQNDTISKNGCCHNCTPSKTSITMKSNITHFNGSRGEK